MTAIHARSWRATYAGLLPDAIIDDVVNARTARAERWRAHLAEPEEGRGAFVATVEGQVAGFVFWGSDQTLQTAEVHAIYVDPRVTGRGIGRALLDAAVGDIAARRFGSITLWVLDSNERARGFYEAAGWSVDGETKVEDRVGGTLNEVRYRRSIPGPNLRPSGHE
jgi:ribosomal protein S18 acetylase RimI-like enzyme